MIVIHMKMPPRTAKAMPTASTAYSEAEPDTKSRLGKAVLMFLMQGPPVAVLLNR